MDISYDPKKNARNIATRGLSFDRAAELDFATALRSIDMRKEYGEVRIVDLGYLGARLHVLCYVETGTDSIRVISFRKANQREVRKYAQSKATDQR